MNIKLRLKNKVTLTAIVMTTVAFLYQIFGLLGIVPPISEEDVIKTIGIIVNLFVALGIIVDPTTEGIRDSERALSYRKPYSDTNELPENYWENLPDEIPGLFGEEEDDG